MKKSLSIGIAVTLAFAMMAESAWSQDAQLPRRRGFFEQLFGIRTKPRRVVVERQWWENNPDQIRIIRPQPIKKKSRVVLARPIQKKAVPVQTAYIDPEVEEGLGMGNIVYVPTKLTPVYDGSFRNQITLDTESSSIRAVLTDKTTDLRAPEAIRAGVLEHYKSNGFKPLWSKQGLIQPRALSTLAQLEKAGEEGLELLRYKPIGLDSFEVSENQFQGDVLGLAQFDVSLTIAAVTYAVHQSGGAYEPERLSAYYDLKSQAVSPDVALRVLAYSPFPDEYLKSLAPSHAAYTAMKAELARMPATATDAIMAEGKRVRIGQKDSRIAELRTLLVSEGYLGQAGAEVDFDKEDVLDKAMAKALKAYQAAQGIAQTSNLDSATIRAINGPDLGERRNLLLTNMERMRWLPKNLGSRYVFVNQAAYHVDVIDQGKLVWESKVIVGKPLNQTNVFSDTMETVVINPSWGVPQSILLKEYLPKLRANPGYLDKIGFKVVDEKGEVVTSRSVNWNSVGTNSTIGVQQPPGETNALGKLKFLFPNAHSIYMHDTPNRHLFAESKRNFSHGCVRVENPLEFASVLLQLDAAEIDADIQTGESKAVKITVPTKVHLTYFTAWPDKDGKLQYFSDAYGRDSTLKEARQSVAKTYGLRPVERLSDNTP
jgi:L,D-transpeptidase YcbB